MPLIRTVLHDLIAEQKLNTLKPCEPSTRETVAARPPLAIKPSNVTVPLAAAEPTSSTAQGQTATCPPPIAITACNRTFRAINPSSTSKPTVEASPATLQLPRAGPSVPSKRSHASVSELPNNEPPLAPGSVYKKQAIAESSSCVRTSNAGSSSTSFLPPATKISISEVSCVSHLNLPGYSPPYKSATTPSSLAHLTQEVMEEQEQLLFAAVAKAVVELCDQGTRAMTAASAEWALVPSLCDETAIPLSTRIDIQAFLNATWQKVHDATKAYTSSTNPRLDDLKQLEKENVFLSKLWLIVTQAKDLLTSMAVTNELLYEHQATGIWAFHHTLPLPSGIHESMGHQTQNEQRSSGEATRAATISRDHQQREKSFLIRFRQTLSSAIDVVFPQARTAEKGATAGKQEVPMLLKLIKDACQLVSTLDDMQKAVEHFQKENEVMRRNNRQ